MKENLLTIKELTDAVGRGITPRMVRHYHEIGLLSAAKRSPSNNYRLYNQEDVQRLKHIIALKDQGFQLAHIRKLLETDTQPTAQEELWKTLQQQYWNVLQQIERLRQTAAALEGVLGRDRSCQIIQAEAIAHLQILAKNNSQIHELWDNWDAAIHNHPEEFSESLQKLLPDLAQKSEIEAHLLRQIVLASGDCSLLSFVRISKLAIAVSRERLSSSCQIVTDIPMVSASLDHTRLKHLGCPVLTLIDDPHINNVIEAEEEFWQQQKWQTRLEEISLGSILVIGYTPSVLLSVCEAVTTGKIQPSLIIGLPIGFSHAPAAKRRLMRLGIEYITIEGTIGGGLIASVILNALVESLLEKPDCHCYLG